MTDDPPFLVLGALYPRSPVVITVPHAGRVYSRRTLDAARVPIETMAGLEDRHADALIDIAVTDGATAVIASVARATIDLNRDPREIDPGMIEELDESRELVSSQKLRGGLGLIPRRLAACGELWTRHLPVAELDRRIASVHAPYHRAIAERLTAARDIFGVAYLIDCHSMPPLPRSFGGLKPQIVLGDRHGKSAGARPIATALASLRASGHPCGHNQPYAGGYTLDRHGRPQSGVHAIQIEVDRTLYLDSGQSVRAAGARACARIIADAASALAALAVEALPVAAE